MEHFFKKREDTLLKENKEFEAKIQQLADEQMKE